MKKNILMLTIILGLTIFVFSISCNIDLSSNKIFGTTYAITINGEEADTIPLNGNYYLDSYDCVYNSIVKWDNFTHNLYIKNVTSEEESCSLNFKEGYIPLSMMKVGDYVAYSGDPNNGCLSGDEGTMSTGVAENGNSCLGYNANQPDDGTKDTRGRYGYCYSNSYHYTTYGWRIAYIEDNKVHLISAGSPECRTREASDLNAATIEDLNTAALEYCNATYIDGGVCPTTLEETNAIRALGNTDFEKITQAISGETSSLTSSYGSTICFNQYSFERCGHGNDLLDNGGYYWLAAHNNSNKGVFWYPDNSIVSDASGTLAYGFRPVIRLSSSVYVTGGKGTMENPWQIGI